MLIPNLIERSNWQLTCQTVILYIIQFGPPFTSAEGHRHCPCGTGSEQFQSWTTTGSSAIDEWSTSLLLLLLLLLFIYSHCMHI